MATKILQIFGVQSKLITLIPKKSHRCMFPCTHYYSSNISPVEPTGIWANEKVVKSLKVYEDFVGLTEVKDAQEKVIQAEFEFEEAQHGRRRQHKEMDTIQSRLKAIRSELEKVQRGDKKYLDLVTEEFNVIKEETQLIKTLEVLEDQERVKFSILSSAVRESHEKERARAERTKYWSVSASVIGVVFGIIGTSINNYLRMRELRGIVREQSVDGSELKDLLTKLSDTVVGEHNQMQDFIGDVKNLVGQSSSGPGDKKALSAINKSISRKEMENETKMILDLILKQDKELLNDMSDIKRILSNSKAIDKDGNLVFVGPELEDRLDQTETNLEYKMKVNALWTVTLIYGAFALTLPVLYNIFKGS